MGDGERPYVERDLGDSAGGMPPAADIEPMEERRLRVLGGRKAKDEPETEVAGVSGASAARLALAGMEILAGVGKLGPCGAKSPVVVENTGVIVSLIALSVSLEMDERRTRRCWPREILGGRERPCPAVVLLGVRACLIVMRELRPTACTSTWPCFVEMLYT